MNSCIRWQVWGPSKHNFLFYRPSFLTCGLQSKKTYHLRIILTPYCLSMTHALTLRHLSRHLKIHTYFLFVACHWLPHFFQLIRQFKVLLSPDCAKILLRSVENGRDVLSRKQCSCSSGWHLPPSLALVLSLLCPDTKLESVDVQSRNRKPDPFPSLLSRTKEELCLYQQSCQQMLVGPVSTSTVFNFGLNRLDLRRWTFLKMHAATRCAVVLPSKPAQLE